MTKAQDRLIKTIRGRNFEKYISVAHKDNGDDFFLEVPTLHVFFFHFILVFVVVFVLFLTCLSLHCRLTVIILPFLCLTCLSRNFRRWPPHMWMHLSRLGGFGGGTPPPMSRLLTSFLLLFLYAKRSLMIGFIGLRFGHRYSNPTLLCVVLLLSFFVFSNLHVCVRLVGKGCWSWNRRIWKWMLDRRGLGFIRGPHAAGSLRRALEASSVGECFSCLFWREGRVQVYQRPKPHGFSRRPHSYQTRRLSVFFFFLVVLHLFNFVFRFPITFLHSHILQFPGTFTVSLSSRMLFLRPLCRYS